MFPRQEHDSGANVRDLETSRREHNASLTSNMAPGGQSQASELHVKRSSKDISDDDSQHQRERTMCDICVHDNKVTRRLDCGHRFCRLCIRHTIEMGFRVRTTWPPTCCYYILDVADIAWAGDTEMLEKYKAISREMTYIDPTYCSRPQCSRLLGETDADEEDLVTCKACESRTCVKCKQGPHPGRRCEKSLDPGLEKTAKEERWQRCQKCGRIISISEGCAHIRCLCGHHFCYHCGEVWGRCSCLGFYQTSPRPEEEEISREGTPELHTYSHEYDGRLNLWSEHREYQGFASGGLSLGRPEQDLDAYLQDFSMLKTRRPSPRLTVDGDFITRDGIGKANGHNGDIKEDIINGLAVATISGIQERYSPVKSSRRHRHDYRNDSYNDHNHRRVLQPPVPFHQQLPSYLSLPPSPPPRPRSPLSPLPPAPYNPNRGSTQASRPQSVIRSSASHETPPRRRIPKPSPTPTPATPPQVPAPQNQRRSYRDVVANTRPEYRP
ncbi:hypothetical protein F5X99DRAFT_334282 [Biscogniauxia marginata]|nr:hypothetical protein F5X99DRAFT_334282 [Biscogniauxia marginata]